MAINQFIMTDPRSLLTVVYTVLLVVTLSAVNSSSNNSGVSHGATTSGSRHNVYNTYNTFCTGPSKRIEALLHELKTELSEMKEDIQSLKGNKTIAKGRSEFMISSRSASSVKRHFLRKAKNIEARKNHQISWKINSTD